MRLGTTTNCRFVTIRQQRRRIFCNGAIMSDLPKVAARLNVDILPQSRRNLADGYGCAGMAAFCIGYKRQVDFFVESVS